MLEVGGGRLQKGAAYRCVVVISPRKARKKMFTFIFQLSGWALVAPSCFVLTFLMYQDQCCQVAGEYLSFIFSDSFPEQIRLSYV